jgi:predicted lipoprotein with Yx(FWY)xxD motif
MRSMATALGLSAFVVCLGLVACGGSSGGDASSSSAKAATTATTAATPTGPPIKVRDSDYGKILVDGRGRALYLFTADKGKASKCYGDCAAAWPPYLVKSRPVGRKGARTELTGTVKRSDGKVQATYAGKPLYYYVGDHEPGQVLCQDVEEFGGHWYVVRSSGKPVR